MRWWASGIDMSMELNPTHRHTAQAAAAAKPPLTFGNTAIRKQSHRWLCNASALQTVI